MFERLLASERAKWIFVIGLVAVGAGITAQNVISYPSECLTEKMAHFSGQRINLSLLSSPERRWP
tara:strand:- start:210 stop:404 length:195 start_codon:yes stop_codon:yes gene_type:complete